MPIGSALAAAGTFLAKTALPAAGTFLKTKALPAVGQFVTKKALPAIGKAAVSKVGSQLLTKGAPAAFSFGQVRKSQGLQNQYQGQIDDLFTSAQGRLNTDRFAGLSVPTAGLEKALDTTRATVGDFVQRVAEADPRGLAAGGRGLMAIQEAQQKVGELSQQMKLTQLKAERAQKCVQYSHVRTDKARDRKEQAAIDCETARRKIGRAHV